MNQDFIHKRKIPEHWLYWSFLSPDLLKTPLSTVDNQIVNIIDHGHLNYDNGPDILNAVAEINGIVQKGDIEFHLNPEDWFKHGHHEDRRYQNVILHILWESPQGINSVLLKRFQHIVLKPQIKIPLSEWFDKMRILDQDESGNDPDISRVNLFTLEKLKHYGQIRFMRKVERYNGWLEQFSFDDIMFISLAEVLGYSKNKFPFRQLMWENPPSKILQSIPKPHFSVIGIWTFLAMQANFLHAHSFNRHTLHQKTILAQIYNLFTYFNELGVLPALQLRDWYFARIRPQNSPIIRLAALSQIIYKYHGSSLFKVILNSASQRQTLKNLLLQLHDFLQFPFNEPLTETIQELYRLPVHNIHTIGKNRIRQFILNSALPILFLWAERTGNKGFQQYIEGLFEEFPACDNTKLIQNYQKQLFNQSDYMDFNNFAIYQQGLFEIFAEQQTQNLFT